MVLVWNFSYKYFLKNFFIRDQVSLLSRTKAVILILNAGLCNMSCDAWPGDPEIRQNVANTMLNFFFTFFPAYHHDCYYGLRHVKEGDQTKTTDPGIADPLLYADPKKAFNLFENLVNLKSVSYLHLCVA